jgi:hypothetical protein
MKTMQIKWIFFIVWLGLAMAAFPSISTFARGGADTRKPHLSLDVRNKSLPEVLEQIAAESGYEITLYGELGDFPVSLKIRDAIPEELFRRIFRKMNHTVLWNEKEKKVILSLYDDKGILASPPEGEKQGDQAGRGPGFMSRRAEDIFGKKSPNPKDGPAVHVFGRKKIGAEEKPAVSISGKDTRFVQTTSTMK